MTKTREEKLNNNIMSKFYRHLALSLLTVGTLSATAANYKSLLIHLQDDTQVTVNLTEEFKATFTDTDLHIEGVAETKDVPREKIASFEFDNEISSVDAITADPVQQDGYLAFCGLPAGTAVQVFRTDGVCLATYAAEGDWRLDLSTLPKGVCIVSVNGMSYKINVK